jgi:hypothetical protein
MWYRTTGRHGNSVRVSVAFRRETLLMADFGAWEETPVE